MFYEQLKKFGVVSKTEDDKPHSHLTDRALQMVKTKRNELAHGEISFTDLGREFSVTPLEDAALAVFETLQKIASEVNLYLHNQRYLAQPVVPVEQPVTESIES